MKKRNKKKLNKCANLSTQVNATIVEQKVETIEPIPDYSKQCGYCNESKGWVGGDEKEFERLGKKQEELNKKHRLSLRLVPEGLKFQCMKCFNSL